jgi:hypothetical protein
MFMMCNKKNNAGSVVKIILCQLCHVKEQSIEQWKNFSDEQEEKFQNQYFLS